MNGAADSLIQAMGGNNWNWQAYQKSVLIHTGKVVLS